MRRTIFALLAAASAWACGMSSTPAPNVAAYQQLLTATQTSVAQHRDAGGSLTAASCAAERDRYRAQVQGQLDEMRQMSGDLDACASAMGHAADMASRCSDMDSELAHHVSVVCGGSDADIRAEVARHCDAMDGALDDEGTACRGMASMMGGPMMSSGSCHR